jgi:hypothetical protein
MSGSDALLHRLRLRGKLPAAGPDADALVERGHAVRRGEGMLALTPDGRRAAEAAALVDDADARAALERAYERFLPINADVIRVCHDWQVRPSGAPNDHTDAKYDWATIDRLDELHGRIGPVLRRLGRELPRFDGYRDRLDAARRNVEDGRHEWFAAVRIDSYHTVWMELHEDMLIGLGRTRESETA